MKEKIITLDKTGDDAHWLQKIAKHNRRKILLKEADNSQNRWKKKVYKDKNGAYRTKK